MSKQTSPPSWLLLIGGCVLIGTVLGLFVRACLPSDEEVKAAEAVASAEFAPGSDAAKKLLTVEAVYKAERLEEATGLVLSPQVFEGTPPEPPPYSGDFIEALNERAHRARLEAILMGLDGGIR